MNALAIPCGAPAPTQNDFATGAAKLRSFDRVPPPFDVVPLGGVVAVYDPRWFDIVEGRYYVVESQNPPGGMGWQAYDDHVRRYDGPRTLLKTTRRVIRAIRREQTGDAWWFVHERGSADGPIKDWAAGHNVVGEVVGIYRP